MDFIKEHEAQDVSHTGYGLHQVKGVGLVLLGGVEEREFEVFEPLILIGDQGQIDLDGLLHGASVKALGPPFPVGLIGNVLADLGSGIRAVGRLDLRQEVGALAPQMGATPEPVAGGAPLGRIDISWRYHPATQERGHLLGIDLVRFGLAAVDGFHLEGGSQDDGHAFWSTQVGEPLPSEEAFHRHDQAVPIGGNGLEEGFGSGFHMAVQHDVTVVA
jgi:hypothetical protein